RIAAAGRARGRAGSHGGRTARPLRAGAARGRSELRRAPLRGALFDARGPACDQDPGYLRPARSARRQAAVSAPSAAGVGLSAAFARPSGARGAGRLVQDARPGAEMRASALSATIRQVLIAEQWEAAAKDRSR